MIAIEIYRLILETFTAIGTVGAVAVSLWVVLRKQPPFSIRNVHVSSHIVTRTGKMRETGPAEEVTHFLRLKIENLRNTRMQVFSVSLDADHSKGKQGLHQVSMELSEPNVFIPESSIYEVQYKMDSKSVVGTYSNAKDIILTLSTSFGSQSVPFPKEWRAQLYEALEEPWPFNTPSPFDEKGKR